MQGLIAVDERPSLGSLRHYLSKMVASLMQILNMLASGDLQGLLSPEADEVDDPRRLINLAAVIKAGEVLYVGLDTLSGTMVGSAIGSILIADLAAVAGDRHNHQERPSPVLERLAPGLWGRYPTDEARYTRRQAIAVAAINAHKVAKKAGVPDRERFAAFFEAFILFAALVPTDWARQVSAQELKSLVDAVGPERADAILDRAVRWYRACCVRTGLEAWNYHVLVPDHRMVGAGLEKVADSPVWPWLAGRVPVVWWSLGQACQRLAVLLFWWPFSLILCAAAAHDALLRRRIRQHGFSYASPLHQAHGMGILVTPDPAGQIPMATHDPSYKLLFSHGKMVSDLLGGFVREEWAERLDFNTLERVREVGISQNLRQRVDDVIWRLRIIEDGRARWLYVYILLEFQSTVDRIMAARLLTYIGLLYEDLHRSKEIGLDDPLPPVLPIVLYNGAEPWTAKTDLADLITPNLPLQLRHWQPQMRYLLLEERRYPEADLARLPNVAAALFRLENAQAPENIQRVIGCLVACLVQVLAGAENASLRRAFVVWRKCVLLPARVPGVEIPNFSELQELHDMLAERVKTWTQEWKDEGLREGRREGRQEGEAKLLRRQLTRRFGPLPAWAEERLGQAGETELEEWGDRVLECRSLKEVFGGSA